MSKTIKIKKGYDIKLVGKAKAEVGRSIHANTFALKPDDFKDIKPKLLLKEGSEVKAGQAVFVDKDRPEINFCSPVSGEITEVRRGAKRKILEVIILADKETKYVDFGKSNPNDMNTEDVSKKLLESGAWTMLIERPFGVVANPKHKAKSIFVSGISSAPLASDVNVQLQGQGVNFQTGLDALKKLTDGKVYLSLDGDNAPCDELKSAKGVEINYFQGPHPKGNPGVQINKIDPINKGESIFTVSAEDVVIIGKVFNEGRLNLERTIALAGSEVNDPKHFKIVAGANLGELIKAEVKDGHNRVISGNILTGDKINKDGFLGYYHTEVTSIPEGDYEEFFGWVTPGIGKFSLSRSFFSWLTPNKKYTLDTGMHGEERAFVMTGQYEPVFPFDIFPVQLLKSILVRDIEKMEQLGIYEVVEEDFALPEVICASKLPLQEIVREGLNFLRQEVG